MTDLSIWLIPHPDKPFTKVIQELITDEVPSTISHTLKGKNNFIPHVTLISGIDRSSIISPTSDSGDKDKGKDEKREAQKWLNSLELSDLGFQKEKNEVKLELDHLEAGESMFEKVTIRINEDENLSSLRDFVFRRLSSSSTDTNGEKKEKKEKKYEPHMSLMYADIPQSDIKKKIPLIESQLGWSLGSLFDCCGGTLCLGGRMVVVDASSEKPVDEWEVLAERSEGCEWIMWMMSRNLI